MTSIFPLPSSGRTSDILLHQRLLAQTSGHENALLRIQEQISTGRRIDRPSEDPFAAARAIQLQRLFEQNSQYQSNVIRSTAYLGETEAAISTGTDLLRDVRGLAITGADVSSSELDRDAIIDELRQALRVFVDLGNTNSQGRYLFAGSNTATEPYSYFNESVVFSGNTQRLDSFVDVGALVSSNISGLEVFGGESVEVKSLVDLNPVLSTKTRLADLNGGRGIELGKIELSDGVQTRVVDLVGAETVEEVVRLIENNPPLARQITVDVTSERLVLTLDNDSPGYLQVRDVDGGRAASDLGILTDPEARSNVVTGEDLNPALKLSTKLNDILGIRASATLESVGSNNDILIQALEVGPQRDNYAFQYVNDDLLLASPGLTRGNETVAFSDTPVAARGALSFSGAGNNLQLTAGTTGTDFNQVALEVVDAGAIGNSATVNYDAANKVLQIGIDSGGGTEIQTVINAINSDGTFTAAYDSSDPADGGYNPNALISGSDIGNVRGNTSNSGGGANTFFIHVDADATTGADVVAAINADNVAKANFEASLIETDSANGTNNGSGVIDAKVAALTAGGTGEPLDLNSGIRIDLGGNVQVFKLNDVRTVEDFINKINHAELPVHASINSLSNSIDLVSRASGLDFSVGENGGTTATQLGLRTLVRETQLSELNFGAGIDTNEGTDFSIRRNDGSVIEIDVSNAQTLGDVIDIINAHPQNQDPATQVIAGLAETGNGIAIIDDNPPGSATVAVVKDIHSNAAIDLGLIPVGQTEGYPADGPPPTPATLDVTFSPPFLADTDFRITATVPGTELNGVNVQVISSAASGDEALVNYDPIGKVLTIDVDPTATTANTVVGAITAEGTFQGEINRDEDVGNSGGGLIPVAGSVGVTAGGSSESSALPASASLNFPAPNDINSAFTVTAAQGGTFYNDVDVILQDTLSGDVANVTFNAGAKQLIINIDASATTANTIVAAVTGEGTFTGSLDTSLDPTNDGSGVVGNTGNLATTAGGTPEVLVGRDVNPKESKSVFNSINRLINALGGQADNEDIQRAAGLVEEDLDRMLHALADVSTRQRSLSSFQFQLEQQSVQLQANISQEIDADLVQAVSELTQQQAVYQASLQMIGRILQTSLLDFI